MKKLEAYAEKDYVNVEDPTGLDCSVLPSRTQQQFAEEVDINTIVRRFGLTGELPENVPAVLQGDFEGVHDFQSAMNLVVAARESFDAMPAAVRAEFLNDPQRFLEFVSDSNNFARAAELGLVRPEVIQERASKAAQDAKEALDAEIARRMAALNTGLPVKPKDQSST